MRQEFRFIFRIRFKSDHSLMPPKKIRNSGQFKPVARNDAAIVDSVITDAENPETLIDSLPVNSTSDETALSRRAASRSATTEAVRITSLNNQIAKLVARVGELQVDLDSNKLKRHASQKETSKLRKACSYGGNVNRVANYPIRTVRRFSTIPCPARTPARSRRP